MLSAEILSSAEKCIGKKTLTIRKSTHPWLTEKALQAVAEKHSQEGSATAVKAQEYCTRVIRPEFIQFAEREKQKLGNLKKGSKIWGRTV